MPLKKILFLGGPWPKFASVRIRCVDVAEHLGCDYRINVRTLEDVPSGYDAYVCVKVRFDAEQLQALSKKGALIWDVIDQVPQERQYLKALITSTGVAANLIDGTVPPFVIHHHHCNFEHVYSPDHSRRISWIGNLHWYPHIPGLEHDVYDVQGLDRAAIADLYRRTGIALNVRARTRDYEMHSCLNSGIKLINCIGFGIPSVSEVEPPYKELDEECTIFCTPENFSEQLRELQRDDALYARLRRNCLRRAKQYHISTICSRYKELFSSL